MKTPEHRLASARRYYAAHKEQIKAWRRKYSGTHYRSEEKSGISDSEQEVIRMSSLESYKIHPQKLMSLSGNKLERAINQLIESTGETA